MVHCVKRHSYFRRLLLMCVLGAPGVVCGVQLDTTVVSASRIETPLRQVGASMSVITREQIQRIGVSSLAELLATQPGISFSNNGGPGQVTALQIRGESGFRTKVLIDGVSTLDPSGPQASSRIEHLLVTDHIERIEILRGPQAFIYGADAGGVVNIITRKASSGTEFSVASQAGRYGARQSSGHVSSAYAQGGVSISVHDENFDGFNSLKTDTSGEEDRYSNTTAEINVHQNLSPDLTLSISGRQVKADTAYDNCFSATEDCLSLYEQSMTHLRVEHDGDGLMQSFDFGASQSDTDFLTDGSSSFQTGGQTQQGTYLASLFLSDSIGMTFGFDFQRDKLDGGLFRNQRAWLNEWQWFPSDAITVTLGARHDDHEDFGEHTSARLTSSIVQNVHEQSSLKYRASYGTGFRAPSLFEVANDLAYSPSADIEQPLKEENSRGWDVGIDWFYQSAVMGLTYFNQTIEDQIDYDTALWGYRQFFGTNRSRGVELSGRAPIAKGLSLLANATYNETFDRFGQQRSRQPKKFGNVGLHWASRTRKVNLAVTSRFARDAVDIGALAVPNYAIFNISGVYRVTPELSLNARLDNVTDRDYELARGYATAGRSVVAGFKLTY